MPATGYYDVTRNSLPSYRGYTPWTPSQIVNPSRGVGIPNPNEADGGWYATNLDGQPMHAVTGDQYRTLTDSTHSNRELLQSAAKIAALIYGGAAASGSLGSAGLGFGSGAAPGATGFASGTASASDAAYGSTAAGGESVAGSVTAGADTLGAGLASHPFLAGVNSVVGAGGSMALPGWANLAVSGITALLGKNAADRATNASTAADQAAIDEQRRQYDTTRSDMQPWMTAGTNALGKLQDPNASFTASPDYAFKRSEGQRDVGNYFGARGGAASGNALRALTEFNQNLAGSEFGNWWNRQAGLAGVGQNAATNVGQIGANTATNVSSLTSNQGATRASGILGGNAAISNGLNDAYSNYMYQNGGGYRPRYGYRP